MSVYLKIEDAEALLFPDGVTRVETATDYLGWQASHIQNRGIARVWSSDQSVRARVNHGRWIADCRTCGQGMFTHPVWKIACCAECGAVYRGVDFPDRIQEITELLLARPRRDTQNWHGEAIWELKMENLVHGIWSC